MPCHPGRIPRFVPAAVQDVELGHGVFPSSGRRRAVPVSKLRDTEVCTPPVGIGTALDPCEVILAHMLFLERRSKRLVYPLVQRKDHDAARFPVQPVVQRGVAAWPPFLLKISQQRGIYVVVGIGRGLLAGDAGFLVIGEKEAVSINDSGRVYLEKSVRAVRGEGDGYCLPAVDYSGGVTLDPPLDVDGAEIDEARGLGERDPQIT